MHSPPHRQAPRLLSEARGGGGPRQKRTGQAGSGSESEGGGAYRTDDEWELEQAHNNYNNNYDNSYDNSYDAGGAKAAAG